MRRIILFAIASLTLFGGVAAADRDNHRRNDRGAYRADRTSRPAVRDHRYRGRDTVRVQPQRNVHYNRRPVYVNNGYYQFGNGHRYRYTRPVIHQRYYNYRVRPQIIVENYDPVPGYIWVAGQWQWNGYEWQWVSGHYAADPAYAYDSGY